MSSAEMSKKLGPYQAQGQTIAQRVQDLGRGWGGRGGEGGKAQDMMSQKSWISSLDLRLTTKPYKEWPMTEKTRKIHKEIPYF